MHVHHRPRLYLLGTIRYKTLKQTMRREAELLLALIIVMRYSLGEEESPAAQGSPHARAE